MGHDAFLQARFHVEFQHEVLQASQAVEERNAGMQRCDVSSRDAACSGEHSIVEIFHKGWRVD